MKSRLLELDVLRGIAAIGVMLAHFIPVNSISTFSFNVGYLGIDLFFIISGFVITWTIENKNTIFTFVLNRFARLFPTYWFAVIFTSILILIKNNYSMTVPSESYEITSNLLLKSILNLTMVQYYLRVADLDGTYWTLTVEVLFYAFIGTLLYWKKIKNIEGYSLILLSLCPIFMFDFIDHSFILHKIKMIFIIIPYFPLFVAGIFFYKMKFEKITILRFTIIILTFFLQLTFFISLYKNNNLVSFSNYCVMLGLFYSLFFLLLFDFLKFIIHPIGIWLGNISYGIYLLHNYLGTNILMPYFDHLNFPFLVSIFLSIAIILFLATLVNKLIEQPAKKAIISYFN